MAGDAKVFSAVGRERRWWLCWWSWSVWSSQCSIRILAAVVAARGAERSGVALRCGRAQLSAQTEAEIARARGRWIGRLAGRRIRYDLVNERR